ncbi:hypothetical protein [Nonomuraea diastatica]|uniref:Uncharacterized protein n=1 Tax=Nonomuraea diastatica TaxID=1848329 RepID=A0A4R4VGN8_9ACTN|nr:hypothetical protein [Nonomuraea diastatica]TDD04789.1 hypothetical protein E1294_49925 [Nonomuraea diastatica]
MTNAPITVMRPFDELPAGTVKIPLGLPHGAAWPLVAQIAALSQRRAGCTASIGYMVERLGMHPSTIYAGLAAAGAWIITDTSTSITRRFLAPIPDDAAWARISYRAAAGVGCHNVAGVWTPRRNRSLLLELYCRLRRDEEIGRVRDQSGLAKDLQLTDRTVRSLVATLKSDGWITSHRAGRLIAYRTHDAPLRVLATTSGDCDEAAEGRIDQSDPGHARERSRKLDRNDLGSRGETISETDAAQKSDLEVGLMKHDVSPLAAGEAQHRSGAGDALPRERQTDFTNSHHETAPRVLGAPSVMTAIPLDWQARMTETERERVLTAISGDRQGADDRGDDDPGPSPLDPLVRPPGAPPRGGRVDRGPARL